MTRKPIDLTPDKLKAIQKLGDMAEAKLIELKKNHGDSGILHVEGYYQLLSVKGHVRNVRDNHTNPYAWSSVEGSLATLREVVKRFKFNLKEGE